MKKIQPPQIDDVKKLEDIIAGKHSSKVVVKQRKQQIQDRYVEYRAQLGQATHINSLGLPVNASKALQALYLRRPKALYFIDEYRKDTHKMVCTMCGSQGTWSLEHVLPRTSYPELSFFSWNLVPACECNSKRGAKTVGPNGERILHPHFDNILNFTLLDATLIPPYDKADFEIECNLDENHPDYANVRFHIETFPLRNGIERTLSIEWLKFLDDPAKQLYEYYSWVDGSIELSDAITHQIQFANRRSGTPNNWDAILLRSMLEAEVLDWLENNLTRTA